MVTLICGTNKPGNNSSRVAAYYGGRLKKKGIPYRYFSIEDMPSDVLNNDMYTYNRHAGMNAIQDDILVPATRFVFFLPEYNGSFPGMLKAFIDASDIKRCWHNKKACLVGIASGRAGNLRGMEHFTNILNHMRISVLHLKIPVSSVEKVLEDDGQINDPEIKRLMDEQIDLLMEF